jgi:hypothetical protein
MCTFTSSPLVGDAILSPVYHGLPLAPYFCQNHPPASKPIIIPTESVLYPRYTPKRLFVASVASVLIVKSKYPSLEKSNVVGLTNIAGLEPGLFPFPTPDFKCSHSSSTEQTASSPTLFSSVHSSLTPSSSSA